MIKYYFEENYQLTNNKILLSQDYFNKLNLSFNEYYNIYDNIEISKTIEDLREYYDLFNDIDDIDFIKECLKEGLKRLIEIKSHDDITEQKINDYKEEFNYYPDFKEKNFIKKISHKKEFGMNTLVNEMLTIEDKCNIDFFELAPHQIFLKNLLSKNTPYNGILIFHGVGVGKTCSGVSIAENFKDIYGNKGKRIIILSSKNIQIGWKKTIHNHKKNMNQCTGDTYLNNEKDEVKSENMTNKKIKKYYEMYGYAAFANKIKKLLDNSTKHIPKANKKEIFLEEINIIKNNFSDRVLIIDEAHNIRGDGNQDEARDTIKYISKVIEYSTNLKLVLLTANPMFNVSTEIIWILNMLLLNDNRTPITGDLFDNDGNLTPDGIQIIKNKSKGYISYLRGENPISFPIRLYPDHNPENIMNKDNSPNINLFLNEIDPSERLSFLELYSSNLNGIQREKYQTEFSKFKGLKNLQIQQENKLLQMSNIVFPSGNYGDEGLLDCFNYKMKGSSPEYEYIDDNEFLDYNSIGDYSCKIKSILEIISKSEGIIFIYTNWIKSGIIPLVLALEQNGYLKYNDSEILKCNNKREPVSYSPNSNDEFKPAKYMVIAGGQENLTNNLKKELEILTSPENKNGELIKVVIGSKVASEGLDFKCIRSIHILEPWHNINKLEQVIGRGIRNCSHTLLDSQERNVTIYLHNSFFTKEIETIDTYLYRYSEKKAKQIGVIENILKKNAIDKYLFQNVNFLSKDNVESFYLKPSHINSVDFLYTPDDKPYSRVCSFQNVCDYLGDDRYDINEEYFNNDTFQIKYSQGLIDIYKKRISLLFNNILSYSFSEIIDSISEYKNIDIKILSHSLNQMIVNKDMITNNSNNGYLIYNNDIFIFQPYFSSDKLLPNYYRIHKGNNRYNYFSILTNEERKKEMKNEKISYDLSDSGPIQKIFNFIINIKKNKNEKEIFKYLSFDKFYEYQYYVDRLSFEEKKILLYSILYSICEKKFINEEFQNYLIRIFQPNFIYFNEDDESFEYYNQINEDNQKKLIGGFLYHHYNKEPIFFKYEGGELSIFNKIDQMSIKDILRKTNKKFLNFTTSWGYATFSSRYKNDNGIIMKIVKNNTKKVSYPPGPGIICRDSNNNVGGSTAEETFNFIIKDKQLKEIFLQSGERYPDIMKNLQNYKKSKSKIDYSILIELCFRYLERFISSDLIWMKYL